MKATKKKSPKKAISGSHITYGIALVSVEVGARTKGNRYACTLNVASSKGLSYGVEMTREQILKLRKAVKV